MRTPPPPPEMTCIFLIQLVFCKKKQKQTKWFIGVEVEQETSAPTPKKNRGSAPALVVTQESFHRTQRMCVTRFNTQEGVNYALLKFLDVKWVNVFAIYLLVVRLLSCFY